MRAKLVVTGINPGVFDNVKQNEQITMRAVSADKYDDDGKDANNTYAKWSPTADLAITITNPALWDKFHIGQKFYVDFTEVVPEPTTPE